MILNERKIRILEAIINDYIASAEPIGSRTIARKHNLGVSSATIRNEMSDLEEMGYIVQPHASAGRVPSDKGYRLYVDSLMRYRRLTEEEDDFIKAVIHDNINHIDYLMRETAKAVSLLTNYTTIVAEPEIKQTKVKHLQLIPFDENSIALILVADNKIIKNQVIPLDSAPDYETLSRLSIILNNILGGLTMEEITEIEVESLDENKKNSDFLQKILDAIINIVNEEDNLQLYMSGVNHLLGFPEFSDVEKAKKLFKTFEEKQILVTLLGDEPTEKVQVVIGSENALEQMQDCSIIRANYSLNNKSLGAIGIIGPTRMDYSQVVSVLYGIVDNLNSLMYLISEDEI